MAITKKAQISDVRSYYDRTMLDRLVPLNTFAMFGQVRNIPMNATGTIKFRRYNSLAAATTPLTEGTTPSSVQATVTDVSASLAEYGSFIQTSDKVNMETEDPIVTELTQVQGEQAALTIDNLVRDVLSAGTNVQYASTATDTDEVTAAMVITADEIKTAVRTLKNANAKRITKMVSPQDAYDTTPVKASFVGFVHPSTVYTLEDLTGFTSVEKYAAGTQVYEGEVGKLGDVRFIETTNAKVEEDAGASSADVYHTLILGADAFGITGLGNGAVQTIRKGLGEGEDPLNQRATVGWKLSHVATRLQEAAMIRIEHGVAA